jgi:ABC-type polysaccharide/polyol phosphate export permease
MEQALASSGMATGEPPAPAPEDAVVVREHRPKVREMVAETWRNRRMLVPLGLRQIIKGYSGTRIGRPWLVIRPLFSVFGMALIFGSVLQVPSSGVPYLLFLLVGMTGWLVIERTVFWATRSFDIYRKVAGRLDVPVLLVPLAAIAPAGVDVLIMSGIAAATAVYYTVTEGHLMVNLGPELLVAAAGMGLGLALALGVGIWLATLNGLARDVRLTLRFVLPIWLYVTPVIYATESLPDRWQFLATINPAAAPVQLVKMGVLGVGEITTAQVAVSIGATVLLLSTGLLFLTRLSPSLLRAPAFIDEEEDV